MIKLMSVDFLLFWKKNYALSFYSHVFENRLLSQHKHGSEHGAVLPLIIVFITAILIFAGLALDTTVLSVTKTEHRQLAENAALAALSTYLNSNPTSTLDARLAQVKNTTSEIIRGNVKFAKPFMATPSNIDNIDTRRGAVLDGADGTLIPGNWFSSIPNVDCTTLPAGNTCPCGPANPWRGACFQAVDLNSASPPPQINAMKADLRLAGASAIKTLFTRIFSGVSDSSISSSAIATTYPRHGVFAVDLSRSSHEETHQPYESTAGLGGMNLSAEYAFSIFGTAANVPGCAVLWDILATPIGSPCDIRGGVVPQLNRNLWYGANFIGPNRPVGPAPPPLRQHFKVDYQPYDLTYTDPGIRIPPLTRTYLVDMWINPAATTSSYEGPEPLNSMIAGVNQGFARVAANTVPGDQIGFIGFDYSARVTQRNAPLSAPQSVTYTQWQNLTDPRILPASSATRAPDCVETPGQTVRWCRVNNHHLITRTESGLHLPEALRQARQLLMDAGNPFGAEEFVVVMSDGITNCRRIGTNPGDPQRVCGNDEASVTASLTQVEDILTNTYAPNSIKAHFIHIGDAAAPHTLLAPSPFRKNPNGTAAGCMTEDESQKYSSDAATPMDNFSRTGGDFGQALLNSGATFDNVTKTYTRASTSYYYEPNRLRSSVALTGGKWFPIRPACRPGENITNFLEGRCSTATFTPSGTRTPNVIANLANPGPGVPNLTDAQGRLMCEPDDSDTYAPNTAPSATDPITPRSSKRTQIMRAIDEILSRSPYIIVQ